MIGGGILQEGTTSDTILIEDGSTTHLEEFKIALETTESDSFLGDGTIDWSPIFDALVAIDYNKDIVFESFSTQIVDKSLSLVCAIWRDTWTDNDSLADHAKQFIGLKWSEAIRRKASNMKA